MMLQEIERKWTLEEFPEHFASKRGKGEPIRQTYLSLIPNEVRVRSIAGRFFLTVKGDGGLSRPEDETNLSKKQAQDLGNIRVGEEIVKTRHSFREDGFTYQIDVYTKPVEGKIVLEVEFPNEEAAEEFTLPQWAIDAGAVEVTNDPRYKNKNLAQNGWPED